MQYDTFRPGPARWEIHLLGLTSLVTVVCVAFIRSTPGPDLFSVPEVIVPLGISVGLSLYTVRLRRRNRPIERPDPMVRYVWAGALGSAGFGAVWTGLHLYHGLRVDVLPDELLSILSVGIAGGVLLGQSASRDSLPDRSSDRIRVLAETSWAGRSEPAPILEAVVETLAELEEVDPIEMEPLVDSIDPDVFSDLRTRTDSQWQLRFSVDEYEVRVNSHGTVTVYGFE